jgi:MATE family multidrug resistance protein
MTSDGVALGTVMARYSGLALALYFFKSRYPEFLYGLFKTRGRAENISMRALFGVNTDLFIRTLLLISVLSTFTSWSARQGQIILAVNSLLLQFFYFFSYLTDGLAFAAESLTGRFRGGRLMLRLQVTVNRILHFGALLALLFSVLYFAMAPLLLHLLTSQTAVRQAALDYLPYIWVVPLISFAAFLWDGIYIGATATRTLRNTMIPASALFFLLPLILGNTNHVLWLAFLGFLFLRSAGLWLASPQAIFSFKHNS